ncbi:hypothetical protein BLA29_011437 [Euroglyphus maynei]|uniref:Uncharacterized protein n=1 Tax=Euroglyphus maynei TaxID=6958 RepID=A0A1Y3AZ09_EURMA|nr:hypothetical protein BLA29_011437 [Euroglyphus maynei]
MKLIQPNKVHLLRGQNESFDGNSSDDEAAIQQSLLKECYQKYGKQYGQIIAKTLAKIFTLLPIMVIVDENIACVHSGIPFPSSIDKNLEQQFYSLKQQNINKNNNISLRKRDNDDDHHHMNQIIKQANHHTIST